MRGLLVAVLILGGALLLAACTKEEEPNDEPTGSPAATSVATGVATGTPAGAAASPTPGRDFVRRPTRPTQTVAPGQTPAPQPTVALPTAAPVVPTTTAPPPTATPPPAVVTAAPTAPPTQTPAPLPPSWQTSAPLDPVTPGTIVELGIRNANGAPGETYPIGMSVQLPDLTSVVQEGTVSGSDWLTFYVGDTMLPGVYYVNFGLPQSDLIYAQTSFEVAGTSLYEPSWQVSAPRYAVEAGTTVEVGLRNENGSPGECYDFTVEVYDPDGYVASGEDFVCADEWTYLTYSDTWISGYYDVSYYVEGVFVTSDYFQVAY